MGPQLCSCGNATKGLRIQERGVQLQWGAATLQLRKHAPLLLPLRHGFAASMGPQLCSCGNAHHMYASRVRGFGFNGAATLQLRKLSGRTRKKVARRRFNGAATLQLRKRRAKRDEGAREQSFNGAATLQLRKPAYAARYRLHSLGFNGAATLQLRKQGNQREYAECLAALQWGRNFAVAETNVRNKTLFFICSASMGPQLCSCGNA